MVKGFVDEVVILCGGHEIARHPRCYGDGVFVADPLHYLALLEMKPGALDQAAALQGWALPEVFQRLRHLLEARMGNRGKREFIQVLRLMEAMPQEIVAFAVTEAMPRSCADVTRSARAGQARRVRGDLAFGSTKYYMGTCPIRFVLAPSSRHGSPRRRGRRGFRTRCCARPSHR